MGRLFWKAFFARCGITLKTATARLSFLTTVSDRQFFSLNPHLEACAMSAVPPAPLPVRLRHTIAQLEAETERGEEDWSPLVQRLRQHLEEVESQSASPVHQSRLLKKKRNKKKKES
jgi:hypothetical protein